MGKSSILWCLLVLFAAGCSVNKDVMFKAPVDYEFDTPPDSVSFAFIIQPNDVLRFRLFANDGFKIIDLVSAGNDSRVFNAQQQFTYLVETDGSVKLPLIDRVHLAGMTIREAELHLEEKYEEDYNRPFVQLSVSNRRVVVFPGGGGDAQVIGLNNNNTTLIEVLGQAGGVNRRGNVEHVKVFRKRPDGTRLAFEFDMSTIEGIQHADMVMQTNDIVYVEPNPELAREILYDINPVITLITNAVLVWGIVRSFQN